VKLVTVLFWALACGLPCALALALLHRGWRQAVVSLMPWATLPALALALLGRPGMMIDIPWLMLGTRLGIDAASQVFLGFTALLWLLAGVYARSYLAQDAGQSRFVAFYLVTMSGNLGLILAQDMLSFLLFFAVMSFASYGLIIHNRDPEAVWAGQVYIALVVVGEVLLFTAMVLAASSAGSVYFPEVTAAVAQDARRDVIIAFVLAGFGIKVGALPLHVWLPLAHPAAPVPASAVLSGTMVKAGLLGWLRLLPLGGPALPVWGALCLVVGLAAALYGVLIGVTQRNPKTVLAYSTISQMGLLTVVVGLGLLVPDSWVRLLSVLLVYAAHHALAKGALFLSVGVIDSVSGRGWQRGLMAAGLLLPALALAGAPLTTGACAKAFFKTAAALAPAPWAALLGGLLPLASLGTTLLMGRFLFQVWPYAPTHPPRPEAGRWLPWAVAASGLPVLAVLVPWELFVEVLRLSLAPPMLWSTLWPVGVGSLLVGGIWGLSYTCGLRLDLHIPAGDLLVPVIWLVVRCWQGWCSMRAAMVTAWATLAGVRWRPRRADAPWRALLLRLEGWFGYWIMTGTVFLLLIAVFFALLIRP
jgi:formate hydrogenlyase subunit 3/multisubunit Na+/H+ antiporter MnhD subunit